jgi:dephospho-CoA kinase
VALTGGIATGKSYCLARFAEAGAPTIDADTLARHAVAPGTSGFAAVVARFGQAVVTPDGQLDREAIGRLVFADADARRALEAIIHPAVYAAIERWFDGLARTGRSAAAIADIPLLYETGRDADFDVVVVAACPADVQLARLMARSQLSEADAVRRIASQLPIDEKAERGDYVIDTSGTFADTDRQVRQIWARLSVGAPRRR